MELKDIIFIAIFLLLIWSNGKMIVQNWNMYRTNLALTRTMDMYRTDIATLRKLVDENLDADLVLISEKDFAAEWFSSKT